jgi:hypothetical protein
LMGDGAVIFMTNSVEAGDQTQPTVCRSGPGTWVNVGGVASPYGLWGALGSRANKEKIEEQLNQ